MLTFLFVCPFIYIILSICNQIQPFSDIQLVSANCNNATVRTKCPRLSTNRFLELTFYSVETKIESQLRILQCRKNQSKYVRTTFALSCKHLYRVNISLYPIFPIEQCKEYCSTVHTSTTWLLGSSFCDKGTTDDCQYDKYKIKENSCLNSSQICSFSTGTVKSISKYPIYYSIRNIRIVSAQCKSLILAADCSKFVDKRFIEFNLYNRNKSLEIQMVKCQNETVKLKFTLPCRGLYYVVVNLGPIIPTYQCDLYCGQRTISNKWFLGSEVCDDYSTDDCKYDQYSTEKNHCRDTRQKCSNSSQYSWAPNLKLVEAYCENATIQTKCPKLFSKSLLKFSIFINKNPNSFSTISAYCEANRNERINATFHINCMNLYRFTVEYNLLNSTTKIENLQSLSSSSLFLGKQKCNKGTALYCENIKNKPEENRCDYDVVHCSNTLDSAGIAVIVFIVALTFSLLCIIVYFIRNRLIIYGEINSQANFSSNV